MSRGLVIKATIIIAFVLAAVTLRVFYLQRSHFTEAEKHYAAGNMKLAVREYGTAMRLYVPFSPYTERSARRLWRMGSEFEENGDLLKAQAAFSALRSSFYAARSLYTPGKGWIEKCDGRLASIRAAMLVREGRVSPGEFETARLRHLNALKADRAPAPLWAALAWVFFTGFLTSVAFLIFRGFGPEGRPRGKEALAGLVAAACSFLLWVIALTIA